MINVTFIIEPWHWVVLSFIALGIESLGFNGFLLGAATAAALNGAILWLLPTISREAQLLIFGFNSILFTIAYWRFWRKQRLASNNSSLNLHNRAAQLVGTILTPNVTIPVGCSKLQIGDTVWKVIAKNTIPDDKAIKIYDYDGMTLFIEAVDIEIITKG